MIKVINTNFNKYQQAGVVLIVALVFLVALTAVAASIMHNTSTDIKMAGASQEKSIVTQETISEMERVIFNEYRKVDGDNELAKILVGTMTFDVTKPSITTATAINGNQYGFDVECPRSKLPTSVGELKCSIKRLQVIRRYGRDHHNSIEVNSGIAQVIKTGN